MSTRLDAMTGNRMLPRTLIILAELALARDDTAPALRAELEASLTAWRALDDIYRAADGMGMQISAPLTQLDNTEETRT